MLRRELCFLQINSWAREPDHPLTSRTVKIETNKDRNEVKWLQATESVSYRCRGDEGFLCSFNKIVVYSSVYFFFHLQFHCFLPTVHSLCHWPQEPFIKLLLLPRDLYSKAEAHHVGTASRSLPCLGLHRSILVHSTTTPKSSDLF